MLKRLLSIVGIHASAHCSCNRRAYQMDKEGLLWSILHFRTILGWLEEEARRRHIPAFTHPASRPLARLAAAALLALALALAAARAALKHPFRLF